MIGILGPTPIRHATAAMLASQAQIAAGGVFLPGVIPGASSQPADLTKELAPNAYNAEILRQMELMRTINRSRNGEWKNGAPGSTRYDITGANTKGSGSEPWLFMPSNGRPFHFQQAANCPAPGTSDFAVVSFVVPNGWNAALWGIANVYTAAGFDEGSGDLIWRISVDGAYAPGFDAITTTLGNTSDSRKLQGPIIAKGNQLVVYTVSVSATAPFPTGLAAKIICTFDGWIYPQV